MSADGDLLFGSSVLTGARLVLSRAGGGVGWQRPPGPCGLCSFAAILDGAMRESPVVTMFGISVIVSKG